MSKKKAPIRALIFDFGKVICDFDFSNAFRRLSERSGRTPQQIDAFFRSSGLEVLYDGGKISSRRFHREVKRGLGHDLDFDGFRRLWNDIFTPNPPIHRLIRRLSPRYRTVLLSNTNAMHYAHLKDRYRILEHFDRHVLSFRERARKPDARIYRTAARACKARPHEIFYIDDREDLTEAAAELGFHVFTYRKNDRELHEAMRRLAIL